MVKPAAQESKQTKDKIKWTLVAVLGCVLLFVLYFNLKPSGSGEKDLALQENEAEAFDYNIPLTPETELLPALEVLTATQKTTNPLVPAMIQNIFSFANRPNGPDTLIVSKSEERTFVLKGTIIDGDNSVAFLNDEIVGLGDNVNGFTVVEITADSVIVKNGEDEITVLPEGDEIDEKRKI